MMGFAALRQESRRITRCVLYAMSIVLTGSAGLAHALSNGGPSASTAAVIYPAKGQSTKQQDKDKYACYDWARGETGFDPAQPSQPAPTSQASQTRAPAGGIVKGAAVGAAVGELAHHDAARGAAAGALGATVRERARERQAAAASQRQAEQQQSVRGQQRASYERAFGACMEGRGYVVR